MNIFRWLFIVFTMFFVMIIYSFNVDTLQTQNKDPIISLIDKIPKAEIMVGINSVDLFNYYVFDSLSYYKTVQHTGINQENLPEQNEYG